MNERLPDVVRLEARVVPRRFSRALFVVEFWLLAPLYLLTGAFTMLVGFGSLHALIAAASILCGGVLALSFLRGGRTELARRGDGYWIVVAFGALWVLAACVSAAWPGPPDGSAAGLLRRKLEPHLVGVPLLVPFAHLCIERWLAHRNREHA